MPISTLTAKAPRALIAFHRVALASLTFTLVSCGGGNSSTSPIWPTQSAASLAGKCAAPRPPAPGVQDVQGSLLDEKNWLAAWTHELYLWYGEVPYPNPADHATAIDYFDALKTPNKAASGKAKDQFHFTYATTEWQALSQAGQDVGYGATWFLTSATAPRHTYVAYTEPSVSVPLTRGAQVLYADGVNVQTANTQADVEVLNAAMFPSNPGETHQFVVQDVGASSMRTVNLTSTTVTSSPVQNVGTLAGGSVGYMLFNDHLATAEGALVTAIAQLKAANVSDLVIDIRYNGGGYLYIASELAYMVAGPTRTQNKTFELIHFNDKHPTVDPVSLSPIHPTPFYPTTKGGASLPHLDLNTVYVLTGPTTCSASESVINSLRGVGVNVVQIGSTTCGKPYGFYPQDNCGTTYFSIQLQGVNAAGFGDYADGFVPQNANTAGISTGAVLPGCSVSDDFNHALGDPAEARLAAALQYRANGTCPAATGFALRQAQSVKPTTIEGSVYKTPFLMNRIMGR